jgi:hypothetical protein
MDGAHFFPDEMTGACERVTEGVSPIALIPGLLTAVAMAFVARRVVRRRW